MTLSVAGAGSSALREARRTMRWHVTGAAARRTAIVTSIGSPMLIALKVGDYHPECVLHRPSMTAMVLAH